jgi:hypothetical protein
VPYVVVLIEFANRQSNNPSAGKWSGYNTIFGAHASGGLNKVEISLYSFSKSESVGFIYFPNSLQ